MCSSRGRVRIVMKILWGIRRKVEGVLKIIKGVRRGYERLYLCVYFRSRL